MDDGEVESGMASERRRRKKRLTRRNKKRKMVKRENFSE
jgi:hypothetical protein